MKSGYSERRQCWDNDLGMFLSVDGKSYWDKERGVFVLLPEQALWHLEAKKSEGRGNLSTSRLMNGSGEPASCRGKRPWPSL
jgi:hypothetical protein